MLHYGGPPPKGGPSPKGAPMMIKGGAGPPPGVILKGPPPGKGGMVTIKGGPPPPGQQFVPPPGAAIIKGGPPPGMPIKGPPMHHQPPMHQPPQQEHFSKAGGKEHTYGKGHKDKNSYKGKGTSKDKSYSSSSSFPPGPPHDYGAHDKGGKGKDPHKGNGHNPHQPPPFLVGGPPPPGGKGGPPPPGAPPGPHVIYQHGPPPPGVVVHHHSPAGAHIAGHPPPQQAPPPGAPPPPGVLFQPPEVPPGHILEIVRNADGTEVHTVRPATEAAPPPLQLVDPATPAQQLPPGVLVPTTSSASAPPPQPPERGPPPSEYLSASAPGEKEIERDDFATRKPDVYDYFRTKNVVQSKEAPGLWDIHLYNGMCRDKHVADFMDCLEAWCTRLMGEKPYHIHRFNLSGNDLSDSAVKKIIETLMTLEIRVDVLDLTKNKIQSDAASKIADYVWSTEPLSELLLDRNLLGFEDVNSVLRACYNHSGYPIRKSYGLPIPLKLGITNNPIVAENRVGELLNTIRKQGGKERVWFCNCEEDLSEKELERHREKLETCYLAVHMPGAFTGTDDRTAVRRSRSRTRTRKRQRKEATSDDEEDEEEEQEVSEQRPARQGRRNAERDKRS